MSTLLYAVMLREQIFNYSISMRDCGVMDGKPKSPRFSKNFETETYQVDFDCKISKMWL